MVYDVQKSMANNYGNGQKEEKNVGKKQEERLWNGQKDTKQCIHTRPIILFLLTSQVFHYFFYSRQFLPTDK